MIDAGKISCLVLDYEYDRNGKEKAHSFTSEDSLENALQKAGKLGFRKLIVYCKSKAEARKLAMKLIDHDFIVEMRNFTNSHTLFVSWR